MQRAGSLVFVDPEDDSPYALALAKAEAEAGSLDAGHPGSRARSPADSVPAFLNQPKYRRPKEYQLVLTALDQYLKSLGPEGEYPVDRYRRLRDEGSVKDGESGIPSNTLNVVSVFVTRKRRGADRLATHCRCDTDISARCEFGGL